MWSFVCFASLTAIVNGAEDSSDLYRRAETIDERVCTPPYPSEQLIEKLRDCDPMVRIAGSGIGAECYDKFLASQKGVTEQHEYICRLSDDERDVLDTLIFDCIRDAALKQGSTEMFKLKRDYEKDPEKVLSEITEDWIKCSEKVLRIN